MSEKRVGAVRISEIPPPILASLSLGEIESANLVEWLATDLTQVVRAVFDQDATAWWDPKTSQLKRLAILGRWLAENRRSHLEKLQEHPSDLVRGALPYAVIALRPEISDDLRPATMDSNMSVRETAWLAARPVILENLDAALEKLEPWAHDPEFTIRRFASEATRPRGVWCNHIGPLKARPEMGLPILEPLRADPAKYVQLSVGNWLNDAGKSRPDWLSATAARWSEESNCKETALIVKRGLRSMAKSG
jgi:3-methyladenine DNA glycosylase AlkC